MQNSPDKQKEKPIASPEDARRSIEEGKSVAMRGNGIVDAHIGLAIETQEELSRLKLLRGEKDNKFGRQVEDSVRHFQRAYNREHNLKPEDSSYLKDDGKVGKTTLRAFSATKELSAASVEATRDAPPRREQRAKGPQYQPETVAQNKVARPPETQPVITPASSVPSPQPESKQTKSDEAWQKLSQEIDRTNQGIDKGIKGARAAAESNAKTIAENDKNRTERPITDKVLGFIHNDAKEHDLRNESLQLAANAHNDRADKLEAAKESLKQNTRQAQYLREQGKDEEAQALMAKALEDSKRAQGSRADLRASQEKATEATTETEKTIAGAQTGTKVLQGVVAASEITGLLVGGGATLTLAKNVYRGYRAAKAVQGTETAANTGQAAARETGTLYEATQTRNGTWAVQDVPKTSHAATTRPNPASSNVTSSPAPAPSPTAGPQVEVPAHLRPQTEIVNTQNGEHYLFKPTNVKESVKPIGDGRYQYEANYDLHRVKLDRTGQPEIRQTVGPNKISAEFKPK